HAGQPQEDLDLRPRLAQRLQAKWLQQRFDLGVHSISHIWSVAYRAAATTFLAASVRSVAGVKFRPLSFSIFRPASTFVPSRRTTNGTFGFTSLKAAMTAAAMMSHFMMPPKMLISTALTFGSPSKIRRASVTCFSLAPPPTSRKLAGSPPWYLM